MSRFARRLSNISSFEVMDILDRAQSLERAGRDVIHLEVGEPDFPTAPGIVAAGRAALAAGATKYTAAAGMPELRSAIAAYYDDQHGVAVAPERIVITAGATGGLLLLAGLLLDPGSNLLLADPGYPCNRNFVQMVAAHALSVPVGAEDAYQLSAEHVQKHWQDDTAAALVASPANPTGSMLTAGQLQALAAATAARDGYLIVDEIYQGLTFGGSDAPTTGPDRLPGTVLQVLDDAAQQNVFVVNSFSKYFGMTGWRLGWIVAPADAVEPLTRLSQNFVIAPSTIAQHGAVAALAPTAMAEHEVRRLAFQERRDFLYRGLSQLGFAIDRLPEGAFYLYARLNPEWEWAHDARGFCMAHLEQNALAFTPGTDFGQHRANEHIRFAYTCDLERLAEALDRLGQMPKRPRG